MVELVPTPVEPPDTAADDPRIGHLLGRRVGPETPPAAVLVGFPSDEGVRRNGGRPGAADGPESLRRRLYGLTPDPASTMRELLERTEDLGDLPVSGVVEEDQERLGALLAPRLDRGTFVVVLGGGHETAYGHFLGYVEAGLQAEILNWDAHADVRPLREGRAHSGSPFRQALVHPERPCRRYRVGGLHRGSAARAHLEFVEEQGGEYVWRDQLDADRAARLYGSLEEPAMVTFDLDAVDQSHAPGVSAPATGGLPADLWLELARRAGRAPAVRSADVVELNPRLDRDGQTARLAALTVWSLLRGLAER